MDSQILTEVFTLLSSANKSGIPCSTCDNFLVGQASVDAISYSKSGEVKVHCVECAKTITPEVGWITSIAAKKTDRCWEHTCRFSCGWETVLGEVK